MSDDLKVRKRKKPKSKSRKEEPVAATTLNEKPEFKVTTQIKRNVPIQTSSQPAQESSKKWSWLKSIFYTFTITSLCTSVLLGIYIHISDDNTITSQIKLVKDQLPDCLLNGLDTSWMPDIQIPSHLDASWIPEFKLGPDSILPDSLTNKLTMDGLRDLSAQATKLAKDCSSVFMDYILLAEESLGVCIDQLMEEAAALGAILQDFGAATIKIEVEKSYQDERDTAQADIKIQHIDVIDAQENVDEPVEEEVAADNPVDNILIQENPQILTTQNQEIEERGSLMKNSEEIQRNLDIIEATVVNAINQKNAQEEKPVLGEE